MTTPPEPISVSASVLRQMFLYLRSLDADLDAFLRSVGVVPGVFQKAFKKWSGVIPKAYREAALPPIDW